MDASGDLRMRQRREQVRLLARNVPALVSGSLLLGAGATVLLWLNQQPHGLVVAWSLALLALGLWRLAMARRFWRRTGAGDPPERWGAAFALASAVAGLCWGSLAWLFFTPDNPLNLAVISILITAILSSATQSLGPFFPAYVAFALPCAMPFAVRCLWSGTTVLVTLGLLAFGFLAMSMVFSLRIARALAEALQLRFENESLIGQLTAEKERAESANVAKTRFLATASHDLRQPIHAMSLFVPALQALAQRDQVSPRTLGSIAERMQGALDTMAQLLSRLLDISRLDAGALQPRPQVVVLGPLLRRVSDEVAQQARAKGLRLRVRGGHLAVHADPAVLHTILSNLAGNAVRYTEHGGVLLVARRRGPRVSIEVWDSGVGIEPHDLPRVTDEFFQAGNVKRDGSQARGFGLGLAIAKRSADLLGATLRLRSRPGHGSVFSIGLPRAEAPTAGPSPCPSAAPARPARTVLVVDDDEHILMAMGLLLRGWGHVALSATCRDEALALVAQAPRPPDIALIDLHLRGHQNGVDVIAALQARLGPKGPHTAIVTGDTSLEVLATIRAVGVTGLHKPVDPETLRRFIDNAPPLS